MTHETLQQKLEQSGDPVAMLRSNQARYYAFPMFPQFTTWQEEQNAWATTATLFDQSYHMTDAYFEGVDAKRLMSDIGINGFTSFGARQAKQLVACNEGGHIIGDAILFAWTDHKFSIVGGGGVLANWVQSHAERNGYDVDISRDSAAAKYKDLRKLFRFQLQGPNALTIITKAHGAPLEPIKFFHIGEFTIAGVRVRALNHTMSGGSGAPTHGLEIAGPYDRGEHVLEALQRAGEEFGLCLGGGIAYSTAGIESGWVGMYLSAIYTGEGTRAHREWLRADSWEAGASLGGSFVSTDIKDYYLNPWDLGYERLIRFDHDFIGREALERMADEPHRRKVWLVWNDEDVASVYSSSLFAGEHRAKYLQVPNGSYVMFQYDAVYRKDRLIGISNRNSYTVNIGRWASLAVLDEDVIEDGAEVVLQWGEPDGGRSRSSVESHQMTNIRATISTKKPC